MTPPNDEVPPLLTRSYYAPCIEHDWADTRSVCCGASFTDPGFPDNDFCSKCGEHSEATQTCLSCEAEREIDFSGHYKMVAT